MINSKDLRIGNIYKTNVEFVGSLEAKINVFKDKSFFVLTEKNLILILQFDLLAFIEPIKLTDEILEQIGAVKINNADFEFNDGLIITHSGDFEFYLTYYYNDGRGEKSLGKLFYKYLHEIQNLYKTLQGTELPININTLKV